MAMLEESFNQFKEGKLITFTQKGFETFTIEQMQARAAESMKQWTND